ncbi:MAG: DUF4041 domain-containing protein [Clostridiales bacterium]|nr:DUF4041 domain-containing protein [Clostridiales bacterium]
MIIVIAFLICFFIAAEPPLAVSLLIGYSIYKYTKDLKLKQNLSNLDEHLKTLSNSYNDLKDEYNNLKDEYNDLQTTVGDIDSLEKDLESLLNKESTLSSSCKKLEQIFTQETEKVNIIKSELDLLEEIDSYVKLEQELSVLQVGVYRPVYNFEISEEYIIELKDIEKQESSMIQDGTALSVSVPDFLLNDKLSIQNQILNTASKLILRAFNNECDSIISKITVKNIENSRRRISASFDQINKLGEKFGIQITSEYTKLKIKEVQLTYEYEVKKQEEKEEQRLIKEQMREEAKVAAEIKRLEKEALKEEELYQKALEKVRIQLEQATEEEKSALKSQIASLEENLKLAEEKMLRAKSMAEQTKSGFVYIISNIGSFGENIYKIGMTRRLDPTERINELSNASVPFPFDVHATIYTDNAPELERNLHKIFDEKRVNKINSRKEFFNVSLSEIENAVKSIHGEIKFTKIAEAIEYRQTLKCIEETNADELVS